MEGVFSSGAVLHGNRTLLWWDSGGCWLISVCQFQLFQVNRTMVCKPCEKTGGDSRLNYAEKRE